MNKFKVFLIILAFLAAAAVVALIYKSFFGKKAPLPLKNLNETIQTQLEVPQTNPFEEAKTNPFKDIKTNPFDF